jgi:hypothetical protein
MSIVFSEMELAKRARVWAALSNLFVDTDISLLRDYMKGELADSPYSERELLDILRNEAGPAFASNLFSIAGEWVGWGASEATTIVLSYSMWWPIRRWLRRVLTKPIVEGVIANHWRFIRPD